MYPEEEPGELIRTIARQAGVITRAQALALGMTSAAVRARLASGRWQRLHWGVVATFSGRPTRTATLWAAVLYAGPNAALSHETAAEVHRFAGRADGPIHVSIPKARRVRDAVGVEIHRVGGGLPGCTSAEGFPVTSVEDTVIELTQAAANLDDAVGWITRACGARRTTPELLLDSLARRSRVRWRRDLEIALGYTGEGVRSPLELRYARDVERRHRLPAGIRQRSVRARREFQDVYYTKYRLTVELDGRAYHPAQARDRDRRRDNAGISRGEATLRYGWSEVSGRPCAIAREVAEALVRRGLDGGGLRSCDAGCPVGGLLR